MIFARVNAHLSRKGLILKHGSIVETTIIAAPSSTRNAVSGAACRRRVSMPIRRDCPLQATEQMVYAAFTLWR